MHPHHPIDNPLFPVFLKLEKLQLLMVGAGQIGLEKLNAVLNNSPLASITIVAPSIAEPIQTLAAQTPNITLIQRVYESHDAQGKDLAIIAINDGDISAKIAGDIQAQGILCNVADKPHLCDFYLGAIVYKGHLKIAISTNGRSPTLAKRTKELLQQSIPDDIHVTIEQLQQIKLQLQGDFASKVKQLNQLTQDFSTTKQKQNYKKRKQALLMAGFMLLGVIVSYFLRRFNLIH